MGEAKEYSENDFEKYFEDYFAEDNPVCREERQYALFLYNRLLDMVGKDITEDDIILEACGLSGKKGLKILRVAYEATYMRDIFYHSREAMNEVNKEWRLNELSNGESCFNRELYEYIKSLPKDKINEKAIPDESKIFAYRNLGGVIDWQGVDSDFVDWVRAMMNAKPDIAILYQADNNTEEESDNNSTEKKPEKYLKFIECKYESPEGTYGESKIKQTDAQEQICNFVCKRILKKETVTPDGVNIVRFKSEKVTKSQKENEKQLLIKEVIPESLVKKYD